MRFNENIGLAVENPLLKAGQAFTEAVIGDIKISEVRAIYPLIRAINSGRLTRNFTFYPGESLQGKINKQNPTGYSSFVQPYGKPILTEHRSSDDPYSGERADIPMGRVVAAGYRKNAKDFVYTPPKQGGYPGTTEGDGHLWLVPAITDPESINRVLSGTYHTVSIGSDVENVYESITGLNIAQLRREDKELPPYRRGQVYNNKLSFWTMGSIVGRECSYVNNPSDEFAGTAVTDLGLNGIKLLVGDKKVGSKEFNFFDAKTGEKYEIGCDEMVIDESFCPDSLPNARDYYLTVPLVDSRAQMKESTDAITEGCIVSWGFGSGQILSIHSFGTVPGVPVSMEATPENKIARIQVYKNGQPTENFVAQRLNYLKELKNDNK
jgi:hypothetical protein